MSRDTRRYLTCLSSIILSPLNSNVKMSPHETGDIRVESEGTATSDRDQRVHQGRLGVSQRRRTPLSERAPHQTLEKASPRSRGGGASFADAKIQLYQSLDGRVSLYYGDARLEHTNATGG